MPTPADRTFDWKGRFDRRSLAFPVTVPADLPRSKTWPMPERLNQGAEGACTGFATAHQLAATPWARPVTNWLAQGIYHRARQIDEWPGENYEGSSVLAAVKAVSELRAYQRYEWAFGEEMLRVGILGLGPAILGIPWLEGMLEPDAKGVIVATGSVLGGHAIFCRGYNYRLDQYRLTNSWGADWGQINGECFIAREDLAKLLQMGGEACIPIKSRF